MNTKQTREEFVKTVRREINDREKLLEFYHTRYLPTIKDLDGWNYDYVRLRDAIQCHMRDPLMFLWNDNIHNPSKPQLSLRKRLSQYNNLCEKMNVPISIKSGKIDYEGTVAQNWPAIHFSQTIEELKKVVANYDTLMSVADEFKTAVEKFSKLPRRFREHLCRQYIPQTD